MGAGRIQAVGIIGTGEIGWRMGKLLAAAGHPVIGYDNRPEALQRPKASGFVVADDVRDLCKRADIVITCVTDGAALRDVVTGRDGIAEALTAGKPLIDTTSAEPWITHELAATLQARGIPFLDAPVSGGVPAADAGKMNFMVGGDADLLKRCRPLLEHLGPVIMHVGRVGAGHAVKAVNMLALAASMLALSEALAVGRQRGESLKALVEAIEAGLGASYSTRVHFPRFIIPGNYGSGFTFDLMLKDLAIGIGLADRSSIPLFLERTAFELYRAAAHIGLRDKDNTRMVEPLMSLAKPAAGAALSRGIADLETAAAACNVVIAAEALCLGATAGLSSATVLDVLGAGSADSRVLSQYVPAYLTGVETKPFPTLGELQSAVAAVNAEAAAGAIPAPLLGQASAICSAAIRRHGADADGRRIVDLLAEWTGEAHRVQRQGPGGAS